MKKKLITAFDVLLSGAKKVIIIPHKNPDGDAIGSSLSLNFFLNKIGHKSQIISPNHYPCQGFLSQDFSYRLISQ